MENTNTNTAPVPAPVPGGVVWLVLAVDGFGEADEPAAFATRSSALRYLAGLAGGVAGSSVRSLPGGRVRASAPCGWVASAAPVVLG